MAASPYQRTLNLPRTAFPMKANLPAREPEIQAAWEARGLEAAGRAARRGARRFILHDGPPYANGDIHIGTALNKVLKDIVVRFRRLEGFDAPYVPGWDTHGLPIEHAAVRELGLDWRNLDPITLREACREYALRYLDVQRRQFRRLGVAGDWEHPYVTLDPGYEAVQIEVFGRMALAGHIYRGLKPVYWCAECETALAEAEIEYARKTSPSIYVRFEVTGGKQKLPEGAGIAIWTTTPWTLPANLAIALGAGYQYVLVETARGPLLLAEDLAGPALAAMGLERGRTLGRFSGEELEGVVCRHPWIDRPSLVVLAEHVGLDQGTGAVHISPGHGHEDFETGRRYGLDVLQPLDGQGRFTEAAGRFAGLRYDEGNAAIIQHLREVGALLGVQRVEHEYPHCWRCKHPILFRATEQWFASIDGFRQAALEAVNEVQWIPSWGRERIGNMVRDRGDWCISRQRVWGVPIPIFYCEACGTWVITRETVDRVRDVFRDEGSNAWYRRPAADFLPPGFRCPACGGGTFRKETDTMDVWFDSGSSHAAVLETRPELGWPADLYLEGSDQHRGWFQSSLLTSVATRGRAPYRAVLTHGFVVDGEGRKMSKSLGNVVSPEEVIRQYGADILRLWVTSADYRADIRVSPDILKQLADVYRKIRNTCRFILGNLYDFDPAADAVPYASWPELDRWAVSRLTRLVDRVRQAYGEYAFHQVHHAVHHFCAVEMSAFYLDVLKDRLYVEPAGAPARRAGQTAMAAIVEALAVIMSPILCHTADEVWQAMPARDGRPWSVHLATWPELDPRWADPALEARWARLLEVRDATNAALEAARAERTIGDPREAVVTLWLDAEPGPADDLAALLEGYKADLPTLFLTSGVTVERGTPPDPGYPSRVGPVGTPRPAHGLPARPVHGVPGLRAVSVARAPGEKCERCWWYREDTGRDPAFARLCARCAAIVQARQPGVAQAGSPS